MPRTRRLPQRLAQQVACPKCGAAPGKKCTGPLYKSRGARRYAKATAVHVDRVLALKQALSPRAAKPLQIGGVDGPSPVLAGRWKIRRAIDAQ
jgi:hypothetical protein